MLDIPVQPNSEALLSNLSRERTPKRVHYMELFLDGEIKSAIAKQFGIGAEIPENDPSRHWKFEIELQRFLGYDYVRADVGGLAFPRDLLTTLDTTQWNEQRREKRHWTDEHTGPIKGWEEFEQYPWPDPAQINTKSLEWLTENLPEDMCIVAGCHSIFEQVTWLMGYENLCYQIHDTPELVKAMFDRIGSIFYEVAKVLVQFERLPMLFGGDDMGFKTGTP